MVATVHIPHGPDNLRIVLKAGFSPEKATMTVADLVAESRSPTKRSSRFVPSTNPSSLPLSYPQTNISAAPTNDILIHHLHNNQTSLIDLTWSRTLLPSDIPNRIFPLRIVNDGVAVAFSLTTETLISTPSDFRSILLTPDWVPKSDHQGLLLTSLRTFGLAREADVKTILDYMHSGRFNSAVHNEGVYSLDRCISILSLASGHAMSRVVELVLIEMNREVLYPSSSQHYQHQDQAVPIDISAAQLECLCRVRDTRVYAWIQNYIITIFRTPKGQRGFAKNAVEECVGSQGVIFEGSSILQRIMQGWFRDNPNPGRGRREGELARLRGLRASIRGDRAGSGSGAERSPNVVDEGFGTPGSGSSVTVSANATVAGRVSASARRARGRGRGSARGRVGGRPRASSATPTPASQGAENLLMAAPNTPAARSMTERGTPDLPPPSSVTLGGSPLKNQVRFEEMDVDDEEGCQNKGEDEDGREGGDDADAEERSDEDDYGWEEDLQRQKEAREGLHKLLLSHVPL